MPGGPSTACSRSNSERKEIGAALREIRDHRERVLVVGAGIAGLATALSLAPRPVTLLARCPAPADSATAWAQGGVAAATGPGDSPASHAADTLTAGADLSDPGTAHWIAEAGPACIEQLAAWGVPFARGPDGAWARGLEGAHSHRRIHHTTGDGTGADIVAALTARARDAPHIDWLTDITVTDLLKTGEAVAGVLATDRSGQPLAVRGRAVVLATGGLGGLYADTTNPPGALGQGLAMALRAGAAIRDPAFVQFHPTALAIDGDPAPLISEAVRGEGARLVDGLGRSIMARVPGAELAPRDVVARAITTELSAGRPVFLDARTRPGAAFARHFPAIAAVCRAAGLNPSRDLLPVRPAAHYHMGGVRVDAWGRSGVAGLFACGEVASTGLHGANRLASNSLLEAVALARRIPEGVDATPLPAPSPEAHWPELSPQRGEDPRGPALARLRHCMTRHVGVCRDQEGLQTALRAIGALAPAHAPPAAWPDSLLAAALIAADALARPESRGAHWRRDAPTLQGSAGPVSRAWRIGDVTAAVLEGAYRPEPGGTAHKHTISAR
jgi:L-aspartate oxidase